MSENAIMDEFVEMPRVDVHTHARDTPSARQLVDTMSRSGVTVCVNLSATSQDVDRAHDIHDEFGGRILLAPRNHKMTEGLWWTRDDLVRFRDAGCAGTKVFAKYQRGITQESVRKKLRQQGELGLPVLGLHISDPPYGKWNDPTYWDCIRDAADVIREQSGVTFVMAHGFWLMNSDLGLDTLGRYFEEYENLNVDLSAVYQWWNKPEPPYERLRAFILDHSDRLLYGTDASPEYARPEYYAHSYRVLETDGRDLRGFFGGDGDGEPLRGLALPEDVLRRIYYENAARLIPRVRESLAGLGYAV